MAGFEHFSRVTSLIANRTKSQVYINGVSPTVKEETIARIGFSQGAFTIKYLGMPLSPTKYSVSDCQHIVEKVKAGQQIIVIRHLSYAAKVQIINAMLFSILSHWCSMFMLPQAVIKQLEQLCRESIRFGSLG